MTQIYHHTKFRWTENLTSRFIQLRKENGKLFTGRKYSAQAGWEYILRLMKREFPTIMADVQYRVLKKKWSNLLQQYKELKNPVQGDKNRADDVSWPFYNAIEEVVHGQVLKTRPTTEKFEETNEIEEEVDPHEFLCVSVTPTDEQISPPGSPVDEKYKHLDDTPIQVEEFSRSRASSKHEPSISVKSLTKLRRTENQSRVSPEQEQQQQLHMIHTAVNHAKRPRQTVVGGAEGNKKIKRNHFERNRQATSNNSTTDAQLLDKFEEFLEYTKQRDEENRLIMLRILSAVEKIADKLD